VLSLSFSFRRSRIFRAKLGTNLDSNIGIKLIGGIGNYLGIVVVG